MENTGKFLYSNNGKIHYKAIGSGTEILLAFHGYGRDMKSMYELEHAFPNYRIFLFDLFYHGESTWQDASVPISQDLLKDFFTEFIRIEGIKRFSILGFSIGAKLALSLVNVLGHCVDNLILIAPDGIKENFWYKLSTASALGRLLFLDFSKQPERYIKVINILLYLGIVNKSLKRFVFSQIRNAEQRERVMNTWLVYRKIKWNKNQLRAKINHSGIFVSLFVGSKDKVIPPSIFDNFINGLSNVRFIKLDRNHLDLVQGVIEYYKIENK